MSTATDKPNIEERGHWFTWYPYLPSFLCFITALGILILDDPSPLPGMVLIIAGAGLHVLASLITRLRIEQLELLRELADVRARLKDE